MISVHSLEMCKSVLWVSHLYFLFVKSGRALMYLLFSLSLSSSPLFKVSPLFQGRLKSGGSHWSKAPRTTSFILLGCEMTMNPMYILQKAEHKIHKSSPVNDAHTSTDGPQDAQSPQTDGTLSRLKLQRVFCLPKSHNGPNTCFYLLALPAWYWRHFVSRTFSCQNVWRKCGFWKTIFTLAPIVCKNLSRSALALEWADSWAWGTDTDTENNSSVSCVCFWTVSEKSVCLCQQSSKWLSMNHWCWQPEFIILQEKKRAVLMMN